MTLHTAIEAQAADWLAERDRADGGAAWTPARQQAFEAWLAESTLHRVALLRLEAAWQRADRLRALQSAPRTAPEAPPRSRLARIARPALRRWMAGAAVALMLAGGVLTVLQRGDEAQQYATEVGKRESVTLADGSQLTLNTATRLQARVNGQQRQVWLEQGEAFFDIAHDAARPFVVMAGAQRITVLGTKFSLRRDGDRLQVAVLEGRVQVQPAQAGAASAPATVLARADAAVADARNVLVTRKTPAQLDASLGWLKGKLVFDQMTLAEAAQQFNRYSRKKLVVADAAAAQIRIGGVFDADNMEAFARLLHAGFGLEVQQQGEDIRVSSPAS
jgi:transmembrane sensor